MEYLRVGFPSVFISLLCPQKAKVCSHVTTSEQRNKSALLSGLDGNTQCLLLDWQVSISELQGNKQISSKLL